MGNVLAIQFQNTFIVHDVELMFRSYIIVMNIMVLLWSNGLLYKIVLLFLLYIHVSVLLKEV